MSRLPHPLVSSSGMLIATLLGACGGSADGGPLPVDFASITRDNAPQVARAVMSSAFSSDELGDFAWLTALGDELSPVQAGFAQAKPGNAAITTAARVLEQNQALQAQTPIAPTTSPCAVSGMVELSGDIATTQTLTLGDTFTFVFTDCDDGITTASGTFSMSITGFQGDFFGGSFAFGVDLTLEAFNVALNGTPAFTIDGDVSISLDVSSPPSLALTVDSDSLSVGDGTFSHSLERYSLTQTSDALTGAYTVLVRGRATSSSFSGVVDFDTTVAFESLDGGNPYTGTIKITGNGRGTITVIVLDETAARLEIDEDGNGTVDVVIDTTWDALTSP